MSDEIRCYFAYRSPYSRMGLHLLARNGIACRLIPFTGPPEGTAFSDPTQNKPKLLYFMQDVPRMTARMGLPINSPKPFDVDFDLANRAFVAADQAGYGMAFALAVSDARWGAGLNVSDPDILAECAGSIGWSGFDPDRLATPEIDAVLAEHRSLVKKDQVFGVPFAVWGKQKYWGHDRFELLLEDMANPPGAPIPPEQPASP